MLFSAHESFFLFQIAVIDPDPFFHAILYVQHGDLGLDKEEAVATAVETIGMRIYTFYILLLITPPT